MLAVNLFQRHQVEQETSFGSRDSAEDQFFCSICQCPSQVEAVVNPCCSSIFCKECIVDKIGHMCIEQTVEQFTSKTGMFPGLRVIQSSMFNALKDTCPNCNKDAEYQQQSPPALENLLKVWNQDDKIRFIELLEKEKGVFYETWKGPLENNQDVDLKKLLNALRKNDSSAFKPAFPGVGSANFRDRVAKILLLGNAALADMGLSLRVPDIDQKRGVLEIIACVMRFNLQKKGVPISPNTIITEEFNDEDKPVELKRKVSDQQTRIRQDLLPLLLFSVIVWRGLKYKRIKRIGVVAQSLASIVSFYALERLTQGFCYKDSYTLFGVFVITNLVGMHYLPLKVATIFSLILTGYHAYKPKDHFFC